MTQTIPISVHFWNELNDHLEAQRVLYRRSVMAKIDKVVAVLLLCLGIYCVAVAGVRWWTLVWFVLAVVEWFDVLSVARFRSTIAFRRNPKFREEYHLTFTPENIHFKTLSFDSVIQWTHYERVLESPTLFLLMYGKGHYTVIPKRAFDSDNDTNAFRALLARMVSE